MRFVFYIAERVFANFALTRALVTAPGVYFNLNSFTLNVYTSDDPASLLEEVHERGEDIPRLLSIRRLAVCFVQLFSYLDLQVSERLVMVSQ